MNRWKREDGWKIGLQKGVRFPEELSMIMLFYDHAQDSRLSSGPRKEIDIAKIICRLRL